MAEGRVPTLDDFEGAEHCVLEDVTVQHPALDPEMFASSETRGPGDLRDEIEITDKFRGRRTLVRTFDDGWIEVEVERRGREPSHHRIDCRYLDPVPEMRRYHPIRLLRVTGVMAGVTAACAIPVFFGWLLNYFVPAVAIGTVASALALTVAIYLSHEKITFKTLHGRAGAIHFGAGLGTIKRFHKLIPKLVDAIADAAESVHDETAVYLRAEMREHYRLRGLGVLSEEECAESTGRILGNFDGPL